MFFQDSLLPIILMEKHKSRVHPIKSSCFSISIDSLEFDGPFISILNLQAESE